MAKRKRSPKPSQPRHKSSSPSQFDKRKRLDVPNPNRKKTVRAECAVGGRVCKLDCINGKHAGLPPCISVVDHCGGDDVSG